MRVAIIGSRERLDRENVASVVKSLPPDAVVISGGCEGPDTWAADAARDRGLTVVEHLPNLAGCVKRYEYTEAYYARNRAVVADCDRIIAFVSSNRKGGTEYTVKHGQKAGKPVQIM